MSDTKTPMVHIEIDGKPLKVLQGSMIIEAADAAGIIIPRFCYHKKLAVAANCRMCLVDAEKARKPIPACATPVTDGMKVYTKSPKALAYQKTIMEFLLINHPLDCPICDQGGECELQDMAMGFGKDVSRYNQGKRSVPEKDIGPLIATDLTRCIHCTRCVRFGTEIAGEREVGMLNRGEHSEIASFLSKPLTSELSGNIIDLCPVGALTAKPFRYRARAWELQQKPTIAAHDCVGSNLYAHSRRGTVLRVVPRENEAINEVWISDRDRFSYEGLHHPLRATTPLLKVQGTWKAVPWTEAFEYAAKQLRSTSPKQIGGLASPHSTLEELYLFQKMLRALGCNNIDHRLRQRDFSAASEAACSPQMSGTLSDIEIADFVLLVGSNVRKEQPIVHHRIRKATINGDAQVCAINPAAFDYRFERCIHHIVNLDEIPHTLAALLKALLMDSKKPNTIPEALTQLLAPLTVDRTVQRFATQLRTAERPVILSGALAAHAPQATLIAQLLHWIRHVLEAKGGLLTDGPNTAGAYLAGAIPHRGPGGQPLDAPGLNAADMLATHDGLSTYVLLNTEPTLDSAYGKRVLQTLTQANFVMAMTPFITPSIEAYADLILPIGTAFETAGTFVNAWGEWQSFAGAGKPPKEARPAWKVLRVLANFLDLPGFTDESADAVLEVLKQTLSETHTPEPSHMPAIPTALPKPTSGLRRVAEVPMYAVDSLVRHAHALQQTPEAQQPLSVLLPEALAQSLNVSTGDTVLVQQNNGTSLSLPVTVTAHLANRSVFIPMGLLETTQLGEGFGEISLYPSTA